MQFDVIVVGGSYAGMAAALQIARARRSVVVVDAGLRRNRFAAVSHGFLGQDGRSPDAIAADARARLTSYPTVVWVDGTATRAQKIDNGFSIETADGGVYDASRLVLATGVIDELPEIPGLKERWGRSIFHCPYCHGYELDNGRLGVLATGPLSMHQALLIPEWGETTLFTNGAFEPNDEQIVRLRERGVVIESETVVAITGDRAGVQLHDGRTIELDGLFTAPRLTPASSLAEQLGCALEEGAFGSIVQTDAAKETTVPGVFACGDTARAAGSVTFAVGDGAMAGLATHRSLIF